MPDNPTATNLPPADKPGRSHNLALLQQRLLTVLADWYGPQATVLSRLTLHLAGQALTPDVAVLKKADSLHQQDAAVTEVPLLTVLVLDATTPFGPQVAVARQLVTAGVPSCWLVEPRLRTVTISAVPGEYQSFNHHETLRDPATGIELELARLFA